MVDGNWHSGDEPGKDRNEPVFDQPEKMAGAALVGLKLSSKGQLGQRDCNTADWDRAGSGRAGWGRVCWDTAVWLRLTGKGFSDTRGLQNDQLVQN